jgi:hypothetical protein
MLLAVVVNTVPARPPHAHIVRVAGHRVTAGSDVIPLRTPGGAERPLGRSALGEAAPLSSGGMRSAAKRGL